jgi:hypothetical protein
MGLLSNEGVLITGVNGSGKSSVAVEIAYLFEQRRQPYALLDLDYLGWSFDCSDDDGLDLMLRNVAAVVSNYPTAGISVFRGQVRFRPRRTARHPGGDSGTSAGRSPVRPTAGDRAALGSRRDYRAAGEPARVGQSDSRQPGRWGRGSRSCQRQSSRGGGAADHDLAWLGLRGRLSRRSRSSCSRRSVARNSLHSSSTDRPPTPRRRRSEAKPTAVDA